VTPERIARLREVLDRRQPDLTVVTDFVHKQRNLSALVRIADAVGIGEVHAVVDKRYYKAFRGTAMGSHQWVRVRRHEQLEAALDPLKQGGFQVVAAHTGTNTVDFREVDYTRPTALLMGAEKHGLSVAGMALADHCVAIDMVGMVESLNVSVAAGIILTEALRQKRAAGHYENCRLDRETWSTLFFQWGHPKVRRFCEERGLAYPPLDKTGEIADPSGWYASVRAGTAPRYPDPAPGQLEN
jgi:tRNA (guanosine-2'-O-)-methyltransferase